VNLHAGDELLDHRMAFTFDRAYEDIMIGKILGVSPYYKLLNHVFR
jgi:hypothetical protein